MTIDKLGLSKKALQIATDRPPLWEYRLFAQVIIDEVETVKKTFQQGHRAQDVTVDKVDTLPNLPEWMSKKLDEIRIIIDQLNTLMDSNHDDAFGSPGMPGDVIGIVGYSRKIVTVYFHAVAWSQTVRNTPIDSQYVEIRHEFSSLTTGITTGIEQFGHEILQQIDDAINAPPSGIPRTITIALKIEVPADRLNSALDRLTKETGDSTNENSHSTEISKRVANDFRRKHVVLENIFYWDAENKKLCPAKLEVIGYSFDMTVIGSKQRRTWEFSPDWGELTVSEDKLSEKFLLNLINSKGTEDMEYFTVTLNHDIILKMSSRNFDLLKQHYQEMNELIPALKESFIDKVNLMVRHLENDSEFVEMGKNFIDDMPIVFYTDTKYLMLVECLIGDAYTSIGRSLLLSSEEERDLFKENSAFVESDQESATSYLNDRLTLFAQVLKERVPEANIYTAYIFVYNVVIQHLAQKWETEYKPYFPDIGELDLDTAIERYCTIDTVAHQNIISAGTFVYYLIQQGKFEGGNRNYFDCVNIFAPKLNKIMDGKKYKNFVNRLKISKSEKKYTIDDVDLMSGQEFEKFIAELFSRMGYETEITKATGDQGVDVIASKNGNRIGIQAKCYSGTVGNTAIQEVVAGKNYYRLDKAMVVTNNFFTDSAQQLARANSIILWDRNVLKEKTAEIFNTRSA